jgi:hypothetical protein
VIARFGVRVVLLAAFAAFGSVGFGRSLAALLWMSIILLCGRRSQARAAVCRSPQSLGRMRRIRRAVRAGSCRQQADLNAGLMSFL